MIYQGFIYLIQIDGPLQKNDPSQVPGFLLPEKRKIKIEFFIRISEARNYIRLLFLKISY